MRKRTKMCVFSTFPGKVLALAAWTLLAPACALVPTMTARDAAVLPKGVTRTDTTGGMTIIAPIDTQERRPAYKDPWMAMGGMQEDWAIRKGLGSGRERAYRFGVGLLGFYGGYERAVEIGQPGKWGAVAFGGGAGGIHPGTAGIWPFLQPYGGVIAGRTSGVLRPEILVRAAAQSGIVSRSDAGGYFYMYALGFALAEPRLRIQTETYSLFGGLQVGWGIGRCQECFDRLYETELVVVTPTAGLSFAPDAD